MRAADSVWLGGEPEFVLSGILNLDKPGGISSRAAVDLIGRLVDRRTKVGHAGTLDPLATGVLVIGVGKATRLIDAIQDTVKEYRAGVLLGQRSASHDTDTPLEPVAAARPPREEAIRRALAALTGRIEQVPPSFSAAHVEGRRAYDLARTGVAFELKPRVVRIDALDLEAYDYPALDLRIECGSGTYVRSLVRDLGAALGCGAVMTRLRRTRVGRFTVADAVDPRSLDRDRLGAALQPPRRAVADWPAVQVDWSAVAAVVQGQAIDGSRSGSGPGPETGDGAWLALVDPAGELVAVGQWNAARRRIQPRKVLA